MNERIIKIPYNPRFPQTVIHPELDKKRFAVIVMHRRAGKTVMLINQTIKQAVRNQRWEPRYAYVAPFLKQAKLTTWTYWKHFTAGIPGIYYNESELYMELPGGRRIYLFGADNPDAIRGPYWDGVILDEYAQIKPGVYDEIVRPALADRKGWAIFSGTPKGQNQFLDIYELAQRMVAKGDPDWFHCLYRADETGALDPAELLMMQETMPESTYRQEMLCDFTAAADNVLIPIDLVSASASKRITENEVMGAPKIMALDVARFGDDSSILVKRKGLAMIEAIEFTKLDNMTLASYVASHIDDWNPDALFIDAGRGEGVIDRLRQLRYRGIHEINFGGKPIKEGQYHDKRSEMWGDMHQWLLSGGAIINNPRLKADLVTPSYKYDGAQRLQLESKDDIKKRLGRSPDYGDALALTFAAPVSAAHDRAVVVTKTRYNPLRR